MIADDTNSFFINNGYMGYSRYNQSFRNIENGDTFYGVAESVDKYDGVGISATSSHDLTITLQWMLNRSDTFDFEQKISVIANIPLFEVVYHRGPMFRVTVTNNSGEDTTSFRLMCRHIFSLGSNSLSTSSGVHGNLCSGFTISEANTTTPSFDIDRWKSISIFGSVSDSCVLYLLLSQNDINFYKSGYSISLESGGSEEFCIHAECICAKYISVLCDTENIVVTITVTGK